ncbi:helix-turn-helix domain-containing protein [Streptococcus cameli]
MKFRLKELRKKLDLTIVDVYRATGISQTSLAHYEKGGMPLIPPIEKIAQAYNVSPAWLVGWSDDMGNSKLMETYSLEINNSQSPTVQEPHCNCQKKVIRWVKSR